MRSRVMLTTLLLALAVLWVTGARAQTETPPTPQFAFTGFIQQATIDTVGAICGPPNDPATGLPADRLRGGTMTVNGIKIIVPCNSIIQLPAATMTWADLFDPAQSAPVGSYIGAPAVPVPANPLLPFTKTGLALADYPMPYPSFAVNVVGNVAGKNPDGTDRYIAALIVPVTQQDLNATSGLVSYIDYTIGAFRVGGIANDPACVANGITSPLCSGALVQFNDPVGRWGLMHSPDPRFSGDYENVTIHVSTGFPLCIPRVAPPAIDPRCPLTNRPLNGDSRFPSDPFLATGAPLKIFQMPAPVLRLDPLTGQPVLDPLTGEPVNTVTPDAYKQVPMMVGDQVIIAGTLYKIDPTRTILAPDGVTPIPDNTAANTYVSAHTVEDVMEIMTAPGVPPAYVFVEGVLIGTGGAALPGLLQEATTRLTVVGFTSDPTRLVEIYAQDVNPCTGQETLRLLAITDPATQAFRTRFVHRVLGGLFMPPTRNYVMKTQTQFVDPATGQRVDRLVANGIVAGQFLLPNFEFIVPENHRFGDPLVPGNYQDLPFLFQGSGPVNGPVTATNPASAIVGRLDPWPGAIPNPLPAPVNCAAFGATPIVNAGPDMAASTSAQVTLTGAVTWDTNSNPALRTILWEQVDPVTLEPVVPPTVTLTGATSLIASFITPSAPTTLAFRLTATDNTFVPSGGIPLIASDIVNITVLKPVDLVQFVAASWAVQRGQRGGFGKLNVTASSSDPTAQLRLTEIGVDGSVTDWGFGITTAATPGTFDWIELKGAPQPARLILDSSKGGRAEVTCGAPDGKGTVTCP